MTATARKTGKAGLDGPGSIPGPWARDLPTRVNTPWGNQRRDFRTASWAGATRGPDLTWASRTSRARYPGRGPTRGHPTRAEAPRALPHGRMPVRSLMHPVAPRLPGRSDRWDRPRRARRTERGSRRTPMHADAGRRRTRVHPARQVHPRQAPSGRRAMDRRSGPARPRASTRLHPRAGTRHPATLRPLPFTLQAPGPCLVSCTARCPALLPELPGVLLDPVLRPIRQAPCRHTRLPDPHTLTAGHPGPLPANRARE